MWDAAHVHTEVIDSYVAPTCTTTGLTEGKHCSACGEILVAQEVIPAQHNFVDGNCTLCEITSDEYFTFTLLSDGTYSIRAKDSKNMPTNVVIPSFYDNKPITVIEDFGFSSCNTIVNVVISDSITYIGQWAFSICSSLNSAVIGNNVEKIHSNPFVYCNIDSITVGANNTR